MATDATEATKATEAIEGSAALEATAATDPTDASAEAEPEPGAHTTPSTAEAAGGAAASAAARQSANDLSPAACGDKLAELFPALFARTASPAGATPAGGAQPAPVKPIKLRIHADIQARAPGLFSKRALGIFFSRYTTSNPYLKALAHAPHRFDLDGQPAGEIADEHRQAAFEELARRRAIAIDKRAGERRAAPRRPHDAPRKDHVVGDEASTAPSVEHAAPAAADGGQTSVQTPAHRDGTAGHDNRREGPRGARGDARHRDQPAGTAARPAQDRPRDARPAPGAPPNAASRPHARPDPRRSFSGDAPRRDDRQGMPPPRDRDARQGQRPHGAHPDPRRDRGDAHEAPLPQDPSQRERALLLRAFEGSPLSKANFCALKRMSESDLDAQLELARQERAAPRASASAGSGR